MPKEGGAAQRETSGDRFGYVVSKEDIRAVQTAPTPSQQATINEYRRRYGEGLGFAPHGLHYLAELGGVWLPPELSLEEEE